MRRFSFVVMLALASTVSACGKGDSKAPTGQVVATVDGEEITANELNLELAGAQMPQDPKAQTALRNAVLQTIVNRHIVAKAAREQGLDKTPEAAVQRAKVEDLALIGALEKKLSASVPAPSQEEAQRFVNDHPNSFAQRKIFLVDQVVTPALPPQLVKQMEPLKTLGEVTAFLDRNKVPHQSGVSTIDAAAADPDVIARIASLPPGEVFVIPNQQGLVISQIRDTRVDPFTGPRAVQGAMALLKRKRTQQIVGQQIQQLLQQGSGKVQYADGYKPVTPPARPGAGAPGAAAAGAAPAGAAQAAPTAN